MTKIFFALLLPISLAIAQCTGQVQDTSRHYSNSKFLFKKARKQKTAACIFAVAGTGLALVAAAVGLNTVYGLEGEPLGRTSSKLEASSVLLVIGGASMLASVPFFIASGKNKRKAEISLKSESTFMFQPFRRETKFLSIGMNITLNKF